MAASFILGTVSANVGITLTGATVLKLTNTGTVPWTVNTRFQVVGSTSAQFVKTPKLDLANQVAYADLYTGTVAATLTFSDGTDAATASFTVNAAPSFTLNPASAPVGSKCTVVANGLGCTWVAGSTVAVTGGTGASITGGQTVNVAAQTITFTLVVGSLAGTLTLTDSVNSVTAPFTVAIAPIAAPPPYSTLVPALAQTYT